MKTSVNPKWKLVPLVSNSKSFHLGFTEVSTEVFTDVFTEVFTEVLTQVFTGLVSEVLAEVFVPLQGGCLARRLVAARAQGGYKRKHAQRLPSLARGDVGRWRHTSPF